MTFHFTQYHDRLRETARGFLQNWYQERYGEGASPETARPTTDLEAWKIFAVEQGMAGVGVAKEYGGAGLGELGRIIVMEELGASLCALPYLTTCGIVVDVFNITGEEAAKDKYLPKIAAGEVKAAYCDGHNAVNQVVTNVAYAADADVIILSRQVPDGLDYFAVQSDAVGLVITPVQTLDSTRSFASVDWRQVAQADLEIIGYGSEERHAKMITQSFIGLAADCIGGAQKCHDIILEYAQQKLRLDDSTVTGCAEMLTQIETARAATYAAVIAPPDDKTEAARNAKAHATDMFVKVAEAAIHMHNQLYDNGQINDKVNATSAPARQHPLHDFFIRAQGNKNMFGRF